MRRCQRRGNSLYGHHWPVFRAWLVCLAESIPCFSHQQQPKLDTEEDIPYHKTRLVFCKERSVEVKKGRPDDLSSPTPGCWFGYSPEGNLSSG